MSEVFFSKERPEEFRMPRRRQKYFDHAKDEYFFDRHRPSFEAILYFYQSGGRLRCPPEVPEEIFLNELRFFQVGESFIRNFEISMGIYFMKPEVGQKDGSPSWYEKLWSLFENPEEGALNKALAVLSTCVIVASITAFCLETVPELKGIMCDYKETENMSTTEILTPKLSLNFENPLLTTEIICMAFFAMELVIRFIVCPSKVAFMKSIMNWVDVVTLVPFCYDMLLFVVTNVCPDGDGSGVVSFLRVLRVLRIFKLGKYSEGLKVFAITMKSSFRELVTLALFIVFGILFFSTAVYFAETSTPHSQFVSIPDAFWWSVVSMTTVGYGDVYPVSGWGKVVGTITVIVGILVISLPVPVIVNNFTKFYMYSKKSSDKF